MQKSTKWFLGIFIVLIGIAFGFILLLATVFLGPTSSEFTDEVITGSGEKIAVVEVIGPIYSSEETVRQLKKYREDVSIKAIVLHVNSPGGGVAASQEIYEEVKLSDKEKPVIVSLSSVAASGGYYISCGARTIVANPGTITGSIGVISQFWQMKKLLDKIGIENNTIKSGSRKDIGNPFREMTEEERKYFQILSNDIHEQFIEAVETHRNIAHDTMLQIADGRVFSGRQAYKHKLVDTLGTYHDAIRIAADAANIQEEPAIVKETERKSLFERLFFESSLKKISALKEEIFDQPILQYRMPEHW
ncbi:MAG: signal peptide peptidase SppA [Ignavibacteria bacterium]|nr:signal peptide peptidase SppA [Ignavibacteria bacterium]